MNNLVQFSNGVLSVSDDAGKQTAALPTYNPPAIDLEPVQADGEQLLNPDSAQQVEVSGNEPEPGNGEGSGNGSSAESDTSGKPADAAPVDAAPVDAAPVDAAPVDAAPVDAAADAAKATKPAAKK